MSDHMTDEEHAAADEQIRDAKQAAWLSNNDPAYAKRQARIRESAPLARAMSDVKPFSIFADTSRDPRH
jgi:hypothetical protein